MIERPLTILHVARAPVGGVFRHIADLSLAQSARGHRVGIVCDALTGGAFEAEWIARVSPLLAHGVTRLAMRRSVGPFDLGSLLAVRRHVANLAPDVVHTHGSKGGVFGRLAAASERLRRRPIATFYAPHGGSLHYDPLTAQGRLYFRVERALERVTDGLIHVSHYEARTYRDKVGVPRCPAHVVHNGLRPDEFAPVAPAPRVVSPQVEPRQARAASERASQAEGESRFHVSGNGSRAADFLYIGALRDLKGVDVFFEALARLAAEGLRPNLLVVGDGEPQDVARYRAFVAASGLGERVTFRPPMPAREAFALARTIVVPSRAESLPYIVLEAAAAGLPTIATRVGGIPEIFEGEADRLVPPGDPAALADAMAAALANPERLAAEADARRERLASSFSLERMAAHTEAIYADALAARRAGAERQAPAAMAG